MCRIENNRADLLMASSWMIDTRQYIASLPGLELPRRIMQTSFHFYLLLFFVGSDHQINYTSNYTEFSSIPLILCQRQSLPTRLLSKRCLWYNENRPPPAHNARKRPYFMGFCSSVKSIWRHCEFPFSTFQFCLSGVQGWVNLPPSGLIRGIIKPYSK